MNNEIITTTAAEQELRKALLTKQQAQIQVVLDIGKKLVINENPENILAVTDFIEKSQGIIDTVEEKRKAIKQPHWDNCVNIDAAAKALTGDIKAENERVKKEYKKVADEVDRKKKLKKQNDDRIQAIKEGINNNVMNFSNRIIECDSREKLVAIERLMNLEKANKSKYQEFLPDLVKRMGELKPQLDVLKELYQQNAEQGATIEKAIESGEDGVVYELSEKQDELQGTIQHAKLGIQDLASASYSNDTIVADEVLPEIKAKRVAKDWELVDAKKFMRAHPEHVSLEVDKKKVDELMKQYAKENKFTENSEAVIDGIKYFYKKTY